MNRRIGVLVNPSAGGSTATAADSDVAALGRRGDRVVAIQGGSAEAAEELARGLVAGGLDILVAAGGDGTVHLALQVVVGTSTALGILPRGTGNDAARAVGIPLDDRPAAVEAILGGVGTPFDVGLATTADGRSRHFLCVLSTGFDSMVNERANRMMWPRGSARYVLAMLAELRTFRAIPYRIEADGRDLSSDAVIVSLGNGPSYGGGMHVCPNADLHDGQLSMVWMSRMSRAALLRLFPSVYSGTHLRDPRVHESSARVVRLDAPGQVAYADGERLGPLPVTVRAASDAVRVMTPRPG